MPSTFPEYIPVHNLSVETSPALTDSVVMQKSSNPTNGDVELLTLEKLYDAMIDQSVLDAYTAMGWDNT